MQEQLDRHAIVIRKRSQYEVIDLAVKLARQELFVLAGLFLPLALFFGLLNRLLLGNPTGWMSMDEFEEYRGLFFYTCALFGLMFLEIPFASSLMRTWLGLRTFSRDRRPTVSEALLVWFAALPQLIFFHILFAPFFIFHLFLPEVILLEKTPFRKTKMRPSSTILRTRQLHKGQGGETFGFFLAVLFGIVWATIAVSGIVVMLVETTFGPVAEELSPGVAELPGRIAFYLQNILPPYLWFLFWFVAILQFLRYIDLRIEKEGWDVDLAFRIERSRMTPGVSFSLGLFLGILALFPGALAADTLRLSATEPEAVSDADVENATFVSPVATDEAYDQARARAAKRVLSTQYWGFLGRQFPWYSSSRDAIQPVRFPYDWSWLDKWFKPLPSATPRTAPNFTWLTPLLWAFWFLLFVILLLTLYFLLRFALRHWLGREFLSVEARREAAEKKRRLETLPVEARAEYDQLLAAAERLYRAGDYRGALILYFSYMLIELDRGEHIRLHRGKTNHEYAWELSRVADLRHCYSETMHLFERVYFGEYPIDAEIFETVWSQRGLFQTLLKNARNGT